jgi:hypothetical protein
MQAIQGLWSHPAVSSSGNGRVGPTSSHSRPLGQARARRGLAPASPGGARPLLPPLPAAAAAVQGSDRGGPPRPPAARPQEQHAARGGSQHQQHDRPHHHQHQQHQQKRHRWSGPDLTRPASEVDAPGLTSWITRCGGWVDVGILIARYSRQCNHIHVCAALVRLAHIDGAPGGSSSDRIEISSGSSSPSSSSSSSNSMQNSAALQRPPMRPARDGSATSSSSSSARGRPANWRAFLEQLLALLEPLLPSCSPRQLSNALWALARLGYTPDPGFWAAWQAALMSVMASASCRDASNVLWALATLGLAPPPRLQQALLSAMHRGVTEGVAGGGAFAGGGEGGAGGGGNGGGTAQDAANALWAMSTLRIASPPELLASLCVTMQRQHQRSGAKGVKPQELATFLWAVGEQHARSSGGGGGGRTDMQPSSSWPNAGADTSSDSSSWPNSSSISGRRGAFAAAQPVSPVPPRWLHEQLSRCARGLSDWDTANLIMVLVACARLRQRPPDAWLSGCLRALRPRMAELTLQVGRGRRGSVGWLSVRLGFALSIAAANQL